MSAEFGVEVVAQRAPYAELESNAFSNACNSPPHRPHCLASLQLLVDIASRMPLEPLPAMSKNVEERKENVVTLPPLHDILCGLPIARASSSRSTSSREDGRGKGGSHGGSESPPGGPSPRYWPLTAKMSAKSKRPIPMWPAHASELVRGVNDTWNSFQRANKGRSVTTAEWKAVRTKVWGEYDALMRTGEAHGPLSA